VNTVREEEVKRELKKEEVMGEGIGEFHE